MKLRTSEAGKYGYSTFWKCLPPFLIFGRLSGSSSNESSVSDGSKFSENSPACWLFIFIYLFLLFTVLYFCNTPVVFLQHFSTSSAAKIQHPCSSEIVQSSSKMAFENAFSVSSSRISLRLCKNAALSVVFLQHSLIMVLHFCNRCCIFTTLSSFSVLHFCNTCCTFTTPCVFLQQVLYFCNGCCISATPVVFLHNEPTSSFNELEQLCKNT